MDKIQRQGKKDNGEREDFTVISLDESFFFYDSLIRRVWIKANERPVVRVTGSHKHSCVFGALSLEGKQLFKQYDRFNGDTFLKFLKLIHSKFPKCYLFLDKASPHHRSSKVKKYFEENNDTLIPAYLPTASPEFMVMEEVWNIAKRDLLVLSCYASFTDLKNKITSYFRTKRFKMDVTNYLLADIHD